MCSPLFSVTQLYATDSFEEKRTHFQTFFPEPFFSLLGIVSIAFGAFKTWQQKSVRPFIFFGGIGAAILIIF
jgi:hypothetical protein